MAGAMARVSDHDNNQGQTQNTFLEHLVSRRARDGLNPASEPTRAPLRCKKKASIEAWRLERPCCLQLSAEAVA